MIRQQGERNTSPRRVGSLQFAGALVHPDDRQCPECGGARISADDARGEIFCGTCGLVLRERVIDEGPEWSAHTMEENDRRSRTGPPRRPLFGASDLTTVVPYSYLDARGRPIPRDQRDRIRRMGRLQYFASFQGHGERSARYAARLLEETRSRLELPKTVDDEGGLILRRALGEGASRGRTVMALVAASVYAACRLLGVPRTLNEVEVASGVPRKEIGRAYRTLRKQLRGKPPPIPCPSAYVDRFCTSLGLSNEVRSKALRTTRDFEAQSACANVAPAGVAAASIYAACVSRGEPRTEAAVARIAGVSAATLRHRLRDVEGFPQNSNAILSD